MRLESSSPGTPSPLPSRLADYACAGSLALAATANLWKVSSVREISPIDLTLLGFASLAVLSFFSLLPSPRKGRAFGPTFALVASFIPGLSLASLSQPYSVQKSIALFTLVPVLVLGGSTLLQTPRRRSSFVYLLAFIGVVVSLGLEVRGVTLEESGGRVGLEDGNVIGLGRICCLAAVALLLIPGSKRRRVVHCLLAAVCLHAAILTGSRGPVLGALVALVIPALLSARSARTGFVQRALPLLLGVLSVAYFGMGSRLTIASGGVTDAARLALARASAHLVATRPWGVGWGDFGLAIPLGLRDDAQGWAQYPHNVILESAVEGGLISALVLVVILWRALGRLWRSTDQVDGVLFALLLASLAAATTSGDLSSNRTVWALVGAALATAATGKGEPGQPAPGGAPKPEDVAVSTTGEN